MNLAHCLRVHWIYSRQMMDLCGCKRINYSTEIRETHYSVTNWMTLLRHIFQQLVNNIPLTYLWKGPRWNRSRPSPSPESVCASSFALRAQSSAHTRLRFPTNFRRIHVVWHRYSNIWTSFCSYVRCLRCRWSIALFCPNVASVTGAVTREVPGKRKRWKCISRKSCFVAAGL